MTPIEENQNALAQVAEVTENSEMMSVNLSDVS